MAEHDQPTEALSTGGASVWEQFEFAWSRWKPGQPAPSWSEYLNKEPSSDAEAFVNLLQIDIEHRINSGMPALLEQRYFEHIRHTNGTTQIQPEHKLELIRWEFQQRWKRGERARQNDYARLFPELAEEITKLRARSTCSRCRSQIEVLSVDADFVRCPACKFEMPLAEALTKKSTSAQSPGGGWNLPGYEILGEIGRGGMGVVYKARQVGLNRLVAVKMIRDIAQASTDDLLRFLSEAEAIAQLQHPNIVQIFEITQCRTAGEGPATPCLIMEYVHGTSLDKRIRGMCMPLNAAAELVEVAARAIHFTHERGIIHRDLKPGNLLLASESFQSDASPASRKSGGSSATIRISDSGNRELAAANPNEDKTGHVEPLVTGQLKITDFGLAKRLDSEHGHTKTGEILGTPCYMAPEQARGKDSPMGPWTDVYALGAILYELIAGQPPFKGDTAWATIDLLLTQEPTPPRKIQPTIPRDLETICLKCLNKDHTQRYNSALDLADDLARFRRHEPIVARPMGSLERMWRWCRKEKRVAILAVSMLIVLFVGGAISGGMWWRLRQQTASQIDAELAIIENDLALFGNDELMGPQMDKVRSQRLEQLAGRCENLLSKHGHLPELSRKNAEVQRNLSSIYEQLGRLQEAEASIRRAIDLLQTSQGSNSTNYKTSSGRYYFQLGSLMQAVGRFQEAETNYRLALVQQNDPAQAVEQAETMQKLGALCVTLGRSSEGETMLRSALRLQQGSSESTAHILALARTETSLANTLVSQSQFDEAEGLYGSAIRRQENARAKAPGDVKLSLGLARSITGRAQLLDRLGQTEQARADKLKSYGIFRKLADEHPQRSDFRLEVASASYSFANESTHGGLKYEKWVEAMERESKLSLAEQERFVKEVPDLVDGRRRLAISLNEWAMWVGYKATIASHWSGVGAFFAEALTVYQRAENIWRDLIAAQPDVIAYLNGLAVNHQRYGIVLEQTGKLDEAETRYREAIALQKKLAASNPRAARHRIMLSALHNNLGVVNDRRKKLEPALALFREGKEYAQQAYALNARDPVNRHLIHQMTANIVDVLMRLGRYDEAAANTVESLGPGRNSWKDFSKTLRFLQQNIATAEKDPILTSEQRIERVERYSKYSLAIAKLFALGGSDLDRGDVLILLRREQVFDHIRNRNEFQQYVQDAEARAKPEK